MKLTTRGRYAVTAMLDVALNQSEKQPVALVDIAKRQEISRSYLEQLFGRLRKQGLVTSVRGPNGGYSLAKNPKQITVANIISAIDEPVDTTACSGAENCQNGERCLTHNLWSDLNKTIFKFLDGVSLEQLIQQQKASDNHESVIHFKE